MTCFVVVCECVVVFARGFGYGCLLFRVVVLLLFVCWFVSCFFALSRCWLFVCLVCALVVACRCLLLVVRCCLLCVVVV